MFRLLDRLAAPVAAVAPRRRHALFALPMVVVVTAGGLYLAFAQTVCDPLFAGSAEAAGIASGSAVAALADLQATQGDTPGSTLIPVPPRDFGRSCASGE